MIEKPRKDMPRLNTEARGCDTTPYAPGILRLSSACRNVCPADVTALKSHGTEHSPLDQVGEKNFDY